MKKSQNLHLNNNFYVLKTENDRRYIGLVVAGNKTSYAIHPKDFSVAKNNVRILATISGAFKQSKKSSCFIKVQATRVCLGDNYSLFKLMSFYRQVDDHLSALLYQHRTAKDCHTFLLSYLLEYLLGWNLSSPY